MARLIELAIERFKNIKQTRRINERLDEIHEEIEESGLPLARLRVIDWRLARFEPAGKPILYTRIRGSPKSLEDDSMFLATYAQVRASVEAFSLDDDLKSAIATVAAEQVVPESNFGEIVESLPPERRRKIETIRQKISHDNYEMSLSTTLRFVKKADPELPVTIGNRAFLSAIEDYAKIAERAVQKPEFLDVLTHWGRVDIQALEGMYSRLLALALRHPGRTASEYHRMRLDVTDVDRAPAATREELISLVELGYLKFNSRKRYWPNYAFIKKHHKIKPPRIATLVDWTR